jgi:predicted PurR-regulated permease PerM
MGQQSRFHLAFFLALFISIVLLNFYTFLPLFHALALAAILAGSFYPLHEILLLKLKGNKQLAAVVSTLIITLLFLLPAIYMVFQVSKEAVGLYQNVQNALSQERVRDFFFGEGAFATLFQKVMDTFNVEITKNDLYTFALSKAQTVSGILGNILNNILSNTMSFILQFLMMVLAIFAIFVEGDRLKSFIFKISPLPEDEESKILDKFNQMNYVSLVSNGLGGVIQGLLAGIAFWLCGLPSIFLWTTIMIVLAFIPLLGISLITIPASVILYLQGSTSQAIALFIFTATVSLAVENWFKPKFIGSRVRVNSLLLLFYIVAGMSTFGMLGIFYGPLLCIIMLTMSEIFLDKYLPRFERTTLD